MSEAGMWPRAVACLVCWCCGCGQEALYQESRCESIGPGDLVVTEVLANPEGSDGDREYIELFNASDSTFDLEGLVVSSGKSDGSATKTHRMIEAQIEAGDYFVLGNGAVATSPGLLDYSYGSALGNLRNSEAGISVWCGETLVDEMRYERTTDGRALELDGQQPPHHRSNDDSRNWCAASEDVPPLDDGSFGTPGEPNGRCVVGAPQGTCLDAGVARVPTRPSAQDVHITEWMANPAGLDTDLEWVEVWVERDADLNGLQLGSAEDQLGTVLGPESCFPVGAGARVVFGASPAAAPRVDAELNFTLGNTGARSIVAVIDGTLLDRVAYEGATEGRAWQVGADGEVCLANATEEYSSGNFGTPGEPNPPCSPVLVAGMCVDEGVPRAVVHPSAAEARITEWMADPVAVDNRDGEWVEVRLDATVDLNGLSLSDLSGSATEFDGEECVQVPAGAHVVFVRNVDPTANGGIEGAVGALSLSLNNRDETITLSVAGEVLDSVSYSRSEPGVAMQIDAHGNACAAESPYGDGDLGTPGSANPSCG